jgi:alcohol dehydrogenase (NADP+)
LKSFGYAAHDKVAPLAPFRFERRDPGANDVVVEIAYCGICHSDIHQVRDEWKNAIYPMVPGHEIVGHVSKAGPAVKKFKEGDLAGVGVMVDSCRVCANCKADEEAYCEKGMVGTYNARDYNGQLTFGGYSNNIVVNERYVHSISPKLNLAAVAPLLCAGITTYSPLKFWKAGKGKKVGIVGLGGLGHMGLKFAHSLGAETVLFTTSAGKVRDGQKLGADEVVITKDAAAVAKHKGSFDFILDCVSAPHDVNQYLDLLRLNGTMCLVGLPDAPVTISPFSIITNRRSFSGSMIGGMPETQKMLDYCADHGIVSEIELTSVDKLSEAYDRVVKGDVKYRFVIDMATLPKG